MQSYLGTEPEHYARLNLVEGVVQPWEDGLRTDPDAESFEWWYLEGSLDDGSQLTVEFHTVPPYAAPKTKLTPFISITIDRPDGTNVTRTLTAPREEFAASTDRCDVRIGPNTFSRDLKTYEVHVEIEDLVADLVLVGTVPSWRPATGHLYCDERYVAWLPTVPRGKLSGTLKIAGASREITGVGYHDHNWGTAPLSKLIDHWYWGRARIGDYTVLSLNFISHPDFGRTHHPALMIAKGDTIVVEDHAGIAFQTTDVRTHPETDVPVANTLRYRHQRGAETYTVQFDWRRDVYTLDFGRAGAYHRFLGMVTLDHVNNGALLDKVTDDVMWELLYFGPREAPRDHAAERLAGLPHKA